MSVTADGKLAPLAQFQSGGSTVPALASIDQIPVFIRAGGATNPLLPLQTTTNSLPNTNRSDGASALLAIFLFGSLAIVAVRFVRPRPVLV